MVFWHPFFYSLLPIVFVVFLLKWLLTSPEPHKNKPPSPSKLPIIGNLHQISPFLHRSLQSLAQKYGPLMMLHFGSVPVLVVSSAEVAREITKTHDIVFSNRAKSNILRKLSYNSKDVGFSPYSEYWRQVRSIFVVHLLSKKRVLSFRGVREEEVSLMAEKIKRSCSSSSNSVVNLSDLFGSLTNGVVFRVALGRKYGGGEEEKKLKELLGEFGRLMGVFNVGDYFPWLDWLSHLNGLYGRVDKVVKEMDSFLESVVEEHMMNFQARETNGGESVESERPQDFVDVLLQIQRDSTAGFPIHRDSIKALILEVFVAGSDTTRTSLEWVMAELLKHPKMLKKLQNEVRETAKGKQDITEDDLVNMQYLKAVIKECMRLHPPGPILVPRESTKDVKVMGYDIAAGTQVITNAWAIGRDPMSWDKPEEFKPERLLDSSIDFKSHDFKLITFGAGRRGCPAIQFAMAVEELALASLVLKFDFTLPDGARGENLDMSEAPGLIMHKKSPLLAVATPYSY